MASLGDLFGCHVGHRVGCHVCRHVDHPAGYLGGRHVGCHVCRHVDHPAGYLDGRCVGCHVCHRVDHFVCRCVCRCVCRRVCRLFDRHVGHPVDCHGDHFLHHPCSGGDPPVFHDDLLQRVCLKDLRLLPLVQLEPRGKRLLHFEWP